MESFSEPRFVFLSIPTGIWIATGPQIDYSLVYLYREASFEIDEQYDITLFRDFFKMGIWRYMQSKSMISRHFQLVEIEDAIRFNITHKSEVIKIILNYDN